MGKPIAVFLCTNLKKERTKSMRYDAAKERWMPMEIRGVRGYIDPAEEWSWLKPHAKEKIWAEILLANPGQLC